MIRISIVSAAAQAECEVEPVISQVLAPGNQFFHGKVVMNSAFFENHRSFAKAVEKREIVTDADEGPGKTTDELLEKLFLLGIQVGCRFIQNENLWIHGEERGECGPLFLPKAQIVRRPVAQVLQSDLLQCLHNAPLNFVPPQALVKWAESNILIKGVGEQLVVGVLKEHANFQSSCPEATAVKGFPLIEHRPRRGHVQAVQMFYESCLACSILPHQSDSLTLIELEIDSIEGCVTVGISKGQRADFEEGKGIETGTTGLPTRKADTIFP
jgi:hypothetical protein